MSEHQPDQPGTQNIRRWRLSVGRVFYLGLVFVATVLAYDVIVLHAFAPLPSALTVLAMVALGVALTAANREIRQFESTLQAQTEELERLAAVARRTTNAVVITDAQRRITWVNDGFTRLTGYTLEEAVGQVPGRLLQCEATDPTTVNSIAAALSAGQGFRGEVLNRAKDGREYWVHVDIQPVLDPDGRVMGYMAIESDVTERLDLEQQLSEQAERTELALAGGNLGMWDWEIQTDALVVDARWAAIVGESMQTVGDDTSAWSARVHPKDLPYCLDRLQQYFEQGVPYQDVQFRIRHRDGSWRWVRASGKVVSWDPEGKPRRMVGIHFDVTDRIRRQRERDHDTKRMGLALSAGQMGLWEWDLDTGRFQCDERWAATLGERLTDIVPDATTLMSRLHADDLEPFEQAVQRLADGQATHLTVQCRMRHKSGEWRWMKLFGAMSSFAGHDGAGQIVGVQMDVHDEVVAEQSIARREALLASTVTMAGIGHWEFDKRSNQLFWSEQVKAIHEVDADFVPNVETGIAFYEGKDRDRIARCVERALELGESFDIECRFCTAKGKKRWVRSVGQAVYDGQEIVGVLGAFQDITEQREQREELEASNRALESAQAIARMGSWSVDDSTGEIKWSKQLFEIYDYPIEQGAPDYQTILSHYTPDAARTLDEAVRKARADGTPYALVLEKANAANGIRYVAVDGRARTDASGAVIGLHGTVRDITAEVQREAELREAHSRAEEANRSKSEFLANMSHEIRTPMTAILGYADLLADEALIAERRGEYIETIKRNGQHLLNIINDILDVSKIEAGQLLIESLQVDPEEILVAAAKLMRVQASAKGLDLRLERKTAIPGKIMTDPTRLRQILLNLLGNAIKFSEHGAITIAASFSDALPDGPSMTFEVTDTGIGMDEEQLGRIFNAFTQADASTTRRFGGTGLGLRISKHLAQALGGDITVSSQLGKGSTFTVRIAAPVAEDASQSPAGPIAFESETHPARQAQIHKRPLQGQRVLLMEDGLDNLRLITAHLKRAGAEVTTVRDGSEGLKLLSADGTEDGPLIADIPFDAILSDMQMPVVDGYTAVRMLREKGCALPIVALTAHSMAEDERRCLDAGCDAYAAKPVSRQALFAVLQQAIAARAVA
jgi:PAS domain S-box-containing protein